MITFMLPSMWENGIRGGCLTSIVGICFSSTPCEDFRVGLEHVKCPDLENTLGLVKLVAF